MNNVDIELALSSLSTKDIPNITSSLPQSYTHEDRSDKGWGIVIHKSKDKSATNVDDLIVSYLKGLDNFRDVISSGDAILRIGIYNDNVNYTLNLKSFDILSSFNLTLEASVYLAD